MDSEAKLLLVLIFLCGCVPLAIIAGCFSQRLRDFALFATIVGVVVMTRADLTLAGQFWYRGTSRGIQIALVDLAPLCLLGATLIFPRYARGRFYWPASLGLVLAFFFYCVGSVLAADPQRYGVWELAKYARGIMYLLATALFVRTRRELGVAVFAVCCAVCLEAGNAVEQRLLHAELRPPGTFVHANTLSTYLCLVAPILIATAMSRWSVWLRLFAGVAWLFALMAELMSLSRMGIPTFALVSLATVISCTSLRFTRRKLAMTVAALGVVAAVAYVMWPRIAARYAHGNIRAELTQEGQLETRGMYWQLATMMAEDHPGGVGLNNWSYYVSRTYSRYINVPYADYEDIKWTPTIEDATKTFLPPAADSLPALFIGELGLAGFAVFLLVWLRWFQMGTVFLGSRLNDDPMHRTAIGILFGAFGVLMQSTTEWTYLQPGVFFTCNVLIGILAALHRHRKLQKRERHRVVLEHEEPAEPELIVDPVPQWTTKAPVAQ